jgi:S1-C subfamily serine protease
MVLLFSSQDFSLIIEEAIQGVVTIRTNVGQGTGFIISSDGYLVTNYHVVQGATAAEVWAYSQRKLTGTKQSLDDLNDLSAVQVNAEVDTALAEYDGPTKAELDTAETNIKRIGKDNQALILGK